MQIVVSTVAGGSATASTSTLAGASGFVNAQGLSSLALGVDVTQVAEYIRSGNDLLIVLENGEIITVNGYFAAPVPPDLYLMDGLEAVEAGMEGAAQGAVHPQFAQVANIAANPAVSAVAQAAVATGSVSGGLIAGGVAVAAGAGAAIAVSSDDDDDGDSVDTGEEPPFEPPLEPLTLSNLSVLQNEDGSLTISGLATPGTVAHITLSDGTTVEGYVTDDGTFTVVWTPDNSSLPNGSITVHVSDGERTSEPGTVDYVDTLAPDSPVISYLLTDAGMLAEGAATADTTVGLSGTGEAGATIMLYAGNGDLVGQTSVAEDGSWTFDYTGEALEEGLYSVTAVQTDVNGNVSGASERFGFSVDTTAPATLNFEMTDTLGNETGLIGDGDTTDDPRPMLSGTAEPGARITMLLNGATFATVMAHETTGAWEIMLEQDIPADTHNVTFIQTDAAGNSSPVSAQSFTRTNNEPDIDENSGTTGAVSELVAGEPNEGTGTHTATGSISFTDHDKSDEHIVDIAENGVNYLGDLSATVNSATGAIDWSFAVNDAALTYLGEGETRTQTYTVTLDDQSGATDTVDVTITLTGSNDVPEISASSTLTGSVVDTAVIAGLMGADADNPSLKTTLTLSDQTEDDLLDLLDNGGGEDGFNTVFGAVLAEAGGSVPLAIATIWGYQDAAYSAISPTQSDELNEVGVRLGAAYASYLQGGGTPLTDISAKFTGDPGGSNSATPRDQSLHDNLLGNLNGGALDWRFDDPKLSELQALIESIDSDLLTRTYFAGHEGDDATATRAEDAASGLIVSATGQILASDPDASGAIASYAVTTPQGAYGSLSIDSSGRWTYILDTNGAATDMLGEGETALDTFEVVVTDDKGATAATTVTITITGSNNAPVIDATVGASGTVVELADGDENEGTGTLEASGSIAFEDADSGDSHSVQDVSAQGNAYAGNFAASVNADTGKIDWTFTVADSALEYLGAGETAVQTYTVTLVDENGATDTVDIAVTLTGSNDAPVALASSVLSGAVSDPGSIAYVSSADENGILSVTTQLTTQVEAGLTDLVYNGTGSFQEIFTSIVNDLGNDQALAIAVVWDAVNRAYYDSNLTDQQKGNVNEAGARVGIAYAGYLKAGGMPLVDVVAQYKPDDNDANDTPERVQSLHDNLLGNIIGTVIAGRFETALADELTAAVEAIDPDFLTRVYASGNEGTETTKGAEALEFDIENAIAPMASGKVSAVDPDASGSVESYSVAQSEGIYGSLTIDSDTGEWIYLLDTDGAMTSALAEGETAEDVFTVTVTDDKGATTDTEVVISVTGGNDAPVLDVASAVDDSLQFNSEDDLDDPAWRGGSWGEINIVNPGDPGYVATPDGTAHGLITAGEYFMPYNYFDAYRTQWTGGWTVETSVYLDASWDNGEGFDYTASARGSDGAFQRDFIFHVLKINDGLYISGSNNTAFAPRENSLLGSNVNHYEIADSGWYTLQHVFYEKDGYLAVDLNLVDASGTILFTETRSNTTQDAIEEIGGNAYSWFTYSSVADGLAVDSIDLNMTGVQPGVREMTDGVEGEGVTMLTSSGSIAYSDADNGDSHTVNITANGQGYYGTLTAEVNAQDGTVDWHFEVLDGDIEFLNSGVNLTQSYALTLVDSQGGVDTTEVLVTIRGRTDAPEISGETTGAIMQVGDLAGVNEANADGGLTTDVVISGETSDAWAATLANPGPENFATFYNLLLDDAGDDVALAIATAWDMQDAAYANQANGTPEINTNGVYIGVLYAQYLENGGAPFLGITAKYTVDDGDADVSPERVQSLHDNLLGNISGGAFTIGRFGTQQLIDDLKTYVADNTSTSIASALNVPSDPAVDGRPYISGNENEADSDGRSWDAANGYGPVATGQLIATDIDIGHTIEWSIVDDAGTYGTLMIDDTGRWTYVLDTESNATRALGLNGQGSDTFTVIAEDDFGLQDQVEVTITVNGNYEMQVVSGDDDDTIIVTQDGFEHILAGGGTDTLVLAEDGIDIDFTQLTETQIMGIEIIDMDNGGANALTFDASDIVALLESSETGALYIAGDDQDSVALSSGFAKQGESQVVDDVSYALYSNGATQLHIDDDIDVSVAAGV